MCVKKKSEVNVRKIAVIDRCRHDGMSGGLMLCGNGKAKHPGGEVGVPCVEKSLGVTTKLGIPSNLKKKN